MKVENTFKFKKAIVLDSNRMTEIHSLIFSFCEDVRYEVELDNGRIISCNLEALLSLDNFEKERIQFIRIAAYEKNSIENNNIHINIGHNKYDRMLLSYSNICECSYAFDSMNKADSFEKQILNILEKSKAPYWKLAKVNISTVVFLVSLLYTIYNYIAGKLSDKNVQMIFSSKIVLIAFIIVIVLYFIDKIIHITILRDVNFVWGEETEKYERRKKLRSNILWSIVISMLIGLFANFIFSFFF